MGRVLVAVALGCAAIGWTMLSRGEAQTVLEPPDCRVPASAAEAGTGQRARAYQVRVAQPVRCLSTLDAGATAIRRIEPCLQSWMYSRERPGGARPGGAT